MSDFPIQLVAFPILAFGALGYVAYQRFRGAGKLEQQYTQFRVGALAQRLGLQVVAGDPSFNLFIRQANVDVARGPADGRPIQLEVRLEGSPNGVPLALEYLYRVEQVTGLGRVTWRIWFDCRMAVTPPRSFPPFEVISRSAPLGPIARTLALPVQSTGQPAIDASYEVATDDPALASYLGQHLAPFAQFGNAGVHLVGDGRRIAFVMKQDKAPLLANALYFAEAMASALDALCRAIVR